MYLFLYLIKNHPVGVNLSITLWVQYNCLIGSEVCQCDLCILWTVINPVDYLVLVKVGFTNVTYPIICVEMKK